MKSDVLRVLIVEDSEDDAQLLVRLLKREGYELDYFRVDSARALADALDRQPWDLILADYSMPGFTGTQALAIVRERGLDVPFIFVSGTIGEAVAVEAMRAGAQDFVVKGNLGRLGPAIVRSLREATVRRERARTEQKLRQLYLAVEASANLIVITDAEGAIEYVNPEFCRRTGYAAEELIGRKPSLWKSGRTSQKEYQRLWRMIRRGEQWRGEFDNRRKDGKTISVSATISPIKDESGRITHFVGIEEDITERKQLEEQLRRSQRMEAIGQLTGGVAHDFNNLLTVVIGNIELLQDELTKRPRAVRFAELALAASMRGAELTRQLLAFARRQSLDAKVFDPNALAAETVQLLQRTLGENVRMELVTSEETWPVLADPTQVESALMNLAINARDAMPEGGRLTITIANRELDERYAENNPDVAPGEYVMLAISDTGTGIAPELIDRVFEPFVTTKEAGKGTGLGLSMVYGFVKQSGGHVKLYSELGYGTTVRLYLPRADTELTAADVETPAELQVADQRLTILAVEDNPDVRAIAVEQLRALGYTVLEAADGRQALEMLRSGANVDLLFTDVVMSGMTGLELAREARGLRPRLPILFTSGFADARLRDDTVKHVLDKPYRMKHLAVAVKKALRASRSEAAEAG